MEVIIESQNNGNVLRKTNTLTLKSQLSLSNQKLKYKSYYKKQFLKSDSYKKSSETCENSGLSRLNSINNSSSQRQSASYKKPKRTVSFAPRYRFINYVYYDPGEEIHKDVINVIKEEDKKDESSYKQGKREANDKVQTQCTCSLMWIEFSFFIISIIIIFIIFYYFLLTVLKILFLENYLYSLIGKQL